MPFALAGIEIDRNEAVAEQAGAGAMPAEEVARRRFDVEKGEVQFGIDRHLCPHAGVAIGVGAVVVPGVIAKFAGLGDGVEGPQPLAGAHIEGANIALGVVVIDRREAFAEGGADDDGVARNGGRRMDAGLAGFKVLDLLIPVLLEVDDAVFAEIGVGLAGIGIKADQAIADGGVKDAALGAVAPIAEPAARKRPRAFGAALAFVEAERPQQFAGDGVERDDGAAGAGGGIDDAIDGQRRAFQLVLRPAAEHVGLEAPGDFKILEIVAVDLIERQIAAAGEIGIVGGPVDSVGRRLADDAGAIQLRHGGAHGSKQQGQAEGQRGPAGGDHRKSPSIMCLGARPGASAHCVDLRERRLE